MVLGGIVTVAIFDEGNDSDVDEDLWCTMRLLIGTSTEDRRKNWKLAVRVTIATMMQSMPVSILFLFGVAMESGPSIEMTPKMVHTSTRTSRDIVVVVVVVVYQCWCWCGLGLSGVTPSTC